MDAPAARRVNCNPSAGTAAASTACRGLSEEEARTATATSQQSSTIQRYDWDHHSGHRGTAATNAAAAANATAAANAAATTDVLTRF